MRILLRERKASKMIDAALGSGFTSPSVYAIMLKDGRYLKDFYTGDTKNREVKRLYDMACSKSGYAGESIREIIRDDYDKITTNNLDEAMIMWYMDTYQDTAYSYIKREMKGKFIELKIHYENAYYEVINDDHHHHMDK